MECIVLELSSDKSIFLGFVARDVHKYRFSICKKIRIDACPLLPHVPDYAQITPYAPVENGCVFSAARKYFRAVCQPEVTGRASRTFARYDIPRY